jgi:hypothetical protein
VRARGIEAEILFYREAVKKIGAESPVFLPVRGQKNAPEDGRFPIGILL